MNDFNEWFMIDFFFGSLCDLRFVDKMLTLVEFKLIRTLFIKANILNREYITYPLPNAFFSLGPENLALLNAYCVFSSSVVLVTKTIKTNI